MKYNKKIIIGGTLGAIGVTAAIVTPIVILKKDDDSSDKDTVKNNLKKFEDGESKKISTELNDVIGSKTKGDEVTFKELGYKKPRLSKGVIGKYTIETPYDEDIEEVVVTITLKKNKATATKNITITAISEEKRYLESIARKIENEMASTKDETTFKNAIGDKIVDDVITFEELGLTKIVVDLDSTIAYKVKTSYDNIEKSILITITLEKADVVVEKEVKVWEKEAYIVREEEVQGLLDTEQTRVNTLTSNNEVEITFDDAIVNTATEFTKDTAIKFGIDLKPNDKFTYTYTGTTKAIEIIVKSRAMYSLSAKDAAKSIDITYKKVTIDTSKLVVESFEITKTNGLGTIGLVSGVTLPKGVEAKYFKGNEALEDDGDYLTTITDLANGNKVFVKFFVKDGNKVTHELPTSDFTNPVEKIVMNLDQTITDATKLIVSSFEFSGITGSGKIMLKGDVKLPEEVRIKYSTNDGSYSETAPTNLKNGDEVHIKFFHKIKYTPTHIFPSDFTNTTKIKIDGLAKNVIVTTKLVASSFQFLATIFSKPFVEGKIILKRGVILPEQVKAKYYRSPVEPKYDSYYDLFPHKDLINGDILWVKFYIKNAYRTTHMLPTSKFTNPIRIRVYGINHPK